MARASDVCAPNTRSGLNAEVSDESMQLVVSQISQICRDSSLEFALRVGAVVVHNFYEGDVDAWRTRGPKIHSFRRLSQHPDLPMSPAALYRCVAVFELCERLNATSRWRRLGASHFRTVVGLEPKEQEKLLATANKNRWSVKLLQAAAARRRPSDSRKGGRKRRSTLVKSLSSIHRSLEDCDSDLERDLNSLDPQEFRETAAMLAKTREWLEQLLQLVERRGAATRCG